MNGENTIDKQTRKERTAQRREEFIQKIMDVVVGYWEKHNGEPDFFKKGLAEGNRYLNEQIRLKPQEKEFILSCASRTADVINKSMDIYLKEKN